ncbi:MAG TPA: DUF3333 domain-containing protein, partial [Xanthobacteraceae bacterium]|nr:DUF3333 domain-containing protein [Xanthobacteraceae bacterium]
MTDIAASPVALGRRIDRTSAEAQARVRRRYRAEARFRAYGLIALVVATVFLVVLIADIIVKALPAFTQSSLLLDVAIPADLVEPAKRTDPVALRSADYFPLTRDALKAAIPGIDSRSAERTLTRLLSTGAADRLMNMIVADPRLIGSSVKVPLLLSANADLYFKGTSTAIASRPGRGIATPSGTSGEVTVLTTANDFADDLGVVKRGLAERARQIATEADRLHRIGSATLADRIKELREEAAGYRARFEQPKGEEELDGHLPSLLVAINGGLVKVTKLSDSGVSGEALLPLKSQADAAGGAWSIVTYVTPESNRKATDQEIAFLERFKELGLVEQRPNTAFFLSGDSREPELAGIRGALVGSALTLIVTLVMCLPIGVMAAVY